MVRSELQMMDNKIRNYDHVESPEQPPQVSIHVAKFSESGIGDQSGPKSLLFTKLKSS